ncbi:MAG: DUF47 family protein [Elusimicrobiota bacterium]
MRRSGDSLFSAAFPFNELFRRQGGRLAESAAVLDSIFNEFKDVSGKCARIHALASEADLDAREITRQLSLVLILQGDRGDIHELNMAFESSCNSVKAAAARIGLYGFAEIRASARELTKDLVGMSAEIQKMLEIMGRGTGAQEAARGAVKIRREAESFLLVGLGELYEQQDIKADVVLDIVKWSQIYDRLEDALNRVERVAQIIEGITLKQL